MKPAQRIKLIRSIVKNLANYENWREIDLVLRQFEFRTDDYWNGGNDKASYIVTMTESGTDTQLKDLNAFLLDEVREIESSPEGGRPLTRSVEQCWATGLFNIFISHSSANKADVTKLKEELLRYKIGAFVAHEDILPTEEWQQEILSGLDSCNVLVAWITPDFKTSMWAHQEIGIAIEKKRPIISILRGANPDGFLAKEQGMPLHKHPIESIANNIVEVLIENPRTKHLIHEAILDAFVHSRNFEDARIKIGLLEKFEDWNEEMLAKLKTAMERNSQVYGSYGVPIRIKALIEKHKNVSPKLDTQEIPEINYESEIRPEDLPF